MRYSAVLLWWVFDGIWLQPPDQHVLHNFWINELMSAILCEARQKEALIVCVCADSHPNCNTGTTVDLNL